jgi:hypothetical protein
MAPLPRPFLRFAVGTTLLAPAACTSAGNERPPYVNTPAPEVEGEAADAGGEVEEAPPETLERVNTPPDPEPEPMPPDELHTNTPVVVPEVPEPNDPAKPDEVIEISTNTPPPRPERPPIVNTRPEKKVPSPPDTNTPPGR